MEPESYSLDESRKRLRDWENESSITDAKVKWKRARGDVLPPSIPAMASISVEGSSCDHFGVDKNAVNIPQSELESTEMESSHEPSNAIVLSQLIEEKIPETPETPAFYLEGDITFDKGDPFDSRGNFCDVFLGTHAREGQVALKRLRPKGDEVEMLARQEIKIWMGLSHDHILKCLGVFTSDGHLYMVSPYMKNGNLFDRIKSGNLSGRERLQLIRELAEALAYLHASGHVHGDVKANNVLLSDDFRIQLCDFGLTKLMDSSTHPDLKGAGSTRWQSPELWDGEQKTLASDVYAFAMTIAEILTGRFPFAYLNDSAVMKAVMIKNERPVLSPETSSDGASYANAWDVAQRCWPTPPDDRISMQQAVDSLDFYPSQKGQGTIHARPISKIGTGYDTPNVATSTSDGNVLSPDEDLRDHIIFDSIEPFNSRGQFSDLYLGTHSKLGKVALKRLRRLGLSELDEAALELHFIKETKFWTGFQHRYVLPSLGSFTLRNHRYFASPFMKNGALFEWIKPDTPGLARLRLIFELSDALAYIHSKGFVHGDVQAHNVLLSDDLHVQLCDFRLTKTIESRTSTRFKGTGSFRWQSPELWNNVPKTFTSDVYAFAMTIVEVLTGQIPFPDLGFDAQVMMAVTGKNARPPREPATSHDGTSYEVAWDIAEKGWLYHPSERISMDEAAMLLRVFQTNL